MKAVPIHECALIGRPVFPLLASEHQVYALVSPGPRERERFMSFDLVRGGCSVLDVSYPRYAPVSKERNLVYWRTIKAGRARDTLALHRLIPESSISQQLLELSCEKDDGGYVDLYTWRASVEVLTSSAQYVWVSHRSNGESFTNYLIDAESGRVTMVAGLKMPARGFETFNLGEGRWHAVLFSRSDAHDRESMWERGMPLGRGDEQKVILLSEDSRLNSDATLLVDAVDGDSGFQGSLSKIAGMLFYTVSLFGRRWEVRSFDPRSGKRASKECDWWIPAPISVEGEPYVVRQTPKHFRLLQFFGDGEVMIPREWGLPVTIEAGSVFTCHEHAQGYRTDVRDLRTGQLLLQGRELLLPENGEPILFV